MKTNLLFGLVLLTAAQGLLSKPASSGQPNGLGKRGEQQKSADAKEAFAQNDLAVSLMQQGQFEAAVEQFQALDWEAVPASQRAVYSYNFAQALKRVGRIDEAYEKLADTVVQEPQFADAAHAAFRILTSTNLQQSTSERLRNASDLATTLAENGQPEVARENLYRTLAHWREESDAQALLAALLRCYVAATMRVDEFERSEWPKLKELTSPALDEPIQEIHKAYAGEFQPVFLPWKASDVFPAWANTRWSGDFSALLLEIGNQYEKRDPASAVARYSLAWAIHPQNSEACLYATALLQDHSDGVDPEGAVFSEMIRALFVEKNSAYGEGRWTDILRLHMLLGEIYEREKEWGDASDPMSAIFQYEHALAARERIADSVEGKPVLPGVHLGLARAYEGRAEALRQAGSEHLAARERRKADEQRQEAAVAFLQHHRATDAVAALKPVLRDDPSATNRLAPALLKSDLGKAAVSWALADVANEKGQTAEAQTRLTETVKLLEKKGPLPASSVALEELGQIELRLGNAHRAQSYRDAAEKARMARRAEYLSPMKREKELQPDGGIPQ